MREPRAPCTDVLLIVSIDTEEDNWHLSRDRVTVKNIAELPRLAMFFDRLGVRVPAVLVSPYIPKGTIVPGTEDPANGRVFEHASIPATVTNFFLNGDAKRTDREKKANTFLDLLSDQKRPDADIPYFKLGGH